MDPQGAVQGNIIRHFRDKKGVKGQKSRPTHPGEVIFMPAAMFLIARGEVSIARGDVSIARGGVFIARGNVFTSRRGRSTPRWRRLKRRIAKVIPNPHHIITFPLPMFGMMRMLPRGECCRRTAMGNELDEFWRMGRYELHRHRLLRLERRMGLHAVSCEPEL